MFMPRGPFFEVPNIVDFKVMFPYGESPPSCYIACHDWTCPLFQFFYEAIAIDFGLHRNAEWFTPKHYKMVFAMLARARVFFVKGTKVKLCRWMTIWDSWSVAEGTLRQKMEPDVFGECVNCNYQIKHCI